MKYTERKQTMKNLNKVLSLVLSGSMVVSILSTGALAAPASRSSYSDVPATASYSEAVEYLSSEEIMSGTGDGKFDPQVTVTRAQMVTVLGRMAKAQQVESDAFTDVVPNSWYSGYVGWAVESGIVQGDGNGHFMPDDNVTSEHLNLMLSRYAKTIDRDIKFYDTGAPTVTRADLAQRLYQFYVEPASPEAPEKPDEKPSRPSVITNTVYQDRVVEVEPSVDEAAVPVVHQAPGGTVTNTTRNTSVTFRPLWLMGMQDDGVYAFKDVKYGSADRFKLPTPYQPSRSNSAESPMNAMINGPVPPQSDTRTNNGKDSTPYPAVTPSDSDMFSDEAGCLNLNVWTKSLSTDAKRPVLVFMHGGGYSTGSSIELASYNGDEFARYTDTVFVSVGARLNILGYSDLSALGGDGNLALADMILALEWVKTNIAAFGGDPDNVTIMGQSGGGMKVSALASAPKALEEDLFQKVVASSGFGASARSQAEADSNADAVAANVRESDLFINWMREEKYGETFSTEAWTEINTRREHVALEDGKLPDRFLDTDSDGNKTLKADANLSVYFYYSFQDLDASDIDATGAPTGALVEYGLTNSIYELITETTEHAADTFTVDGSVTWANLINLAATASDEDVFAFLQEVDYDDLLSFGISSGSFTNDGLYFDTAGSFMVGDSLNETAKHYTYLVGHTWGEMAGGSSDGGIMSASPNGVIGMWSEAQKEAYMRNYMSSRAGDYEETKALFEELFPNHEFVEVSASMSQNTINLGNRDFPLSTGLAGGLGYCTRMAQSVNPGQKVYGYFSAYTMPVYGGTTMIHTVDLTYFFHNTSTYPMQIHGDDATARKVSDTMAQSLAAFCRTGDPSIEGLACQPYSATADGASYCTIYDVTSRCVDITFDAELLRMLQRSAPSGQSDEPELSEESEEKEPAAPAEDVNDPAGDEENTTPPVVDEEDTPAGNEDQTENQTEDTTGGASGIESGEVSEDTSDTTPDELDEAA